MGKADKRVKANLLKELHGKLKEHYPPHHYDHVKVWGKFWGLHRAITGTNKRTNMGKTL